MGAGGRQAGSGVGEEPLGLVRISVGIRLRWQGDAIPEAYGKKESERTWVPQFSGKGNSPGNPGPEAKARLREQEQRDSCRFFGLPETRLAFLRLEEDSAGHPVLDQKNIERVREYLLSAQPELVFLPHWNDSNPGHRRVYAMFRRAVSEATFPLIAFLNRDPKTLQMRCDAYHEYGPEIADWKGELLRFHRSQHQRNLNQRGYGFDERILAMARKNAQECSLRAHYAEVFELEFSIPVDKVGDGNL